MPIYEYECRACGAGFEKRLGVEQRLVPQACPTCGADGAVLRMSVPALVGSTPSTSARGAGTCPSTGERCGCGRTAAH